MPESAAEHRQRRRPHPRTCPVKDRGSGEYARQNAKLTEIHRDFFNAVVSGRRPVSDVDTFQQEWLDAGGQLVLEDFEAMLDEAS